MKVFNCWMLIVISGFTIPNWAWGQTIPHPPSVSSNNQSLPYARPHRLALGIGFGMGYVALDSVHQGAEDIMGRLKRDNPTIAFGNAPTSNLGMNLELGLRYYFPYHLLAEIGYGAIYNRAKTDINIGPISGSITNHNLVMELPILFGGYHVFMNRIYLFGAVGPNVFFFPRSYWEVEPAGGMSNFKASAGVGFASRGGADFMLTNTFSLGLDVRYRYLKTGDVAELNSGQTIKSGMIRGDLSQDSYQMNFSGVCVGLNIRFYIM